MNRGILSNKHERVTDAIIMHPDRADSWIAENTGTCMQTVKKIRAELEEKDMIKVKRSSLTRDGRKYPRSVNDIAAIKKEVLTENVNESVEFVKKYVWPSWDRAEIKDLIDDGRKGLLKIELKKERDQDGE